MTIKYDSNGLVPAIIQDATTKNVLMLGYMNEEAYQKTTDTKKVTFFLVEVSNVCGPKERKVEIF